MDTRRTGDTVWIRKLYQMYFPFNTEKMHIRYLSIQIKTKGGRKESPVVETGPGKLFVHGPVETAPAFHAVSLLNPLKPDTTSTEPQFWPRLTRRTGTRAKFNQLSRDMATVSAVTSKGTLASCQRSGASRWTSAVRLQLQSRTDSLKCVWEVRCSACALRIS